MVPDPVVITGEICGTILGLALIAACFVLLMKRLRLTKLSAAQQDADRKPPKGAEPADVPAAEILPGFSADGQDHIRAVGE